MLRLFKNAVKTCNKNITHTKLTYKERTEQAKRKRYQTLDGTLINKYSYEEKVSIYYWSFIKHTEPFGHFELKKINGYVLIYLDSPNGRICYFNKKYTNGILHPLSVVLYFFVFLLLISFIEGVSYKIRKKTK